MHMAYVPMMCMWHMWHYVPMLCICAHDKMYKLRCRIIRESVIICIFRHVCPRKTSLFEYFGVGLGGLISDPTDVHWRCRNWKFVEFGMLIYMEIISSVTS